MATAQKTSPKPAAKLAPAPAQRAQPGKPANSRPPQRDEDKEARKRVVHPLVDSEDENVYPFAEAPADFDPKKHQPLKKRDFVTEVAFYDYKIAAVERQLAKLKSERETIATTGGKSALRDANKLSRMIEKQAEIIASLRAAGLDVDALLKQAEESAKKKLAASAGE